MMPAALVYALMKDEQREAHNRALARHRLVQLLTSTARPDAGGAPCRP